MLQRPNAAGVNASELLARGAREHAAGRLDAAAELYRRVLDLNGDHPEALSNLGLVLGQMKQFFQAEEVLRHALAHSPRHPAALVNLALILHQQQKFSDAIALCERALESISETRHRQKLFNTLALSLIETRRYDDALALLGKMTAAHPRFAGGHHLMGLVYSKRAEHEAALRAFDRACELDARNSESFLAAAECLLLQGNAEGALHRLDKVLLLNGYDVRALALRTLVLSELDRKDDEKWLSDPHRFVHVHRLAELGYRNERIGDLNRRLAEFASNEPSLREDPPEYATHKAWHSTTNLAEVAHPAVDELKTFISYALKQRIASLKDEHPNHPFVKAAPPRCHIDLWAIKMKSGGNLFPHIHKDGWLSGVYYVEVPAIVDDASAGAAGWLKIGTPRRDLTLTREPITRAVKPEPGLMVTFPSYFWHDTVPLPEDNTEERLCLAFDLCPLHPSRGQ
jgi:tetratricopeptide (TPR) repeat protein